MVDFPDAERPVNQIVKPFCLRRVLRSERERPSCHVMLLSQKVLVSQSCLSYFCFSEKMWGLAGYTLGGEERTSPL